MYHIALPEMRDYESYKKLPPEERERYVKKVILDILKLNKASGVTVKQISEKTYFHRSTLAYHLDTLLSTGEVYKYPENSRSALYFPNGNFGDPVSQSDVHIGDKVFTLYLMSNQLGQFLYIQEKQIDVFNVVSVKGGIMIPLEDKLTFLNALQQFIGKAKDVGIHDRKSIRDRN